MSGGAGGRAVILLVGLVLTVPACTARRDGRTAPRGDDVVRVTQDYGDAIPVAGREVITDAMTVIAITRGPITIESLTTAATGDPADVLGFRVKDVVP